MSDAMGRRPEGPGEYTYEGRTVIVRERMTMRGEYEWAAFWLHSYQDGVDIAWRFVDDMPGDFVPLTEPVAAPEPDWSQEPPTEPGDWWCWHRSEEVRRAKVRQADIAGFWRVIFDDGDFALMNKNKNWLGYWWMPATVPQPPGEVGP